LGNTNICQTGSVVLEANAGSGFIYQWQKGSTAISGATNQDYTATSAATYKVMVTNSSNCSKLSAGTKVTNSCRAGSIADQSEASLNLYPNPAVDQTNIQFSAAQTSQVIIKVYDVNGKELKTLLNDNLQQGDHALQFSTGDLSSGVYFVRMFTSSGVENVKLIIQR
jgi:Secretion system C-terminal sorting domain